MGDDGPEVSELVFEDDDNLQGSRDRDGKNRPRIASRYCANGGGITGGYSFDRFKQSLCKVLIFQTRG